jgi:predicted dehydrogenase
MSPVRYAIVGLGHIIQQAVLPAFHARGVNSEIAAFVSGECE